MIGQVALSYQLSAFPSESRHPRGRSIGPLRAQYRPLDGGSRLRWKQALLCLLPGYGPRPAVFLLFPTRLLGDCLFIAVLLLLAGEPLACYSPDTRRRHTLAPSCLLSCALVFPCCSAGGGLPRGGEGDWPSPKIGADAVTFPSTGPPPRNCQRRRPARHAACGVRSLVM
jgi:hypothetical protein